MADHPRSRGVYDASPLFRVSDGGSSPLARGLLVDCADNEVNGRIIPARAGFTYDPQLNRPLGQDHPRSRGVYTLLLHPIPLNTGSSPLARGLPVTVRLLENRRRIIPARAGFTGRCEAKCPHQPDHPRSRGVYIIASESHTTGPGSSPLARGLREKEGGFTGVQGIIPARAGFTQCIARNRPRSRGSSPLARGLPKGTVLQEADQRIIPARAGFTVRIVLSLPLARDHPRSRGVYGESSGSSCHFTGSSPLARGLQVGHRVNRNATGIIPARAGFTLAQAITSAYKQDHPRSRGVYPCRRLHRRCRMGSSPLARGLLHSILNSPSVIGIIPARAGFT